MIGRALTVAAVTAAVLLPQPPAEAATFQSLTISVPAAASLGSASTGAASISGTLGSVTVTTGGSLSLSGSSQWTATVVSTAFTTGQATSAETIPASSVGYTSGSVTATSGLAANLCTPGQLVTPVAIGTAQTAMTCGSVPLLTSTSVTWRPTVQISLPASAVAGTYTGTITHSVA
ncbi:MAG: hypothetical protein ABR549_11490 [Mycobacteriales bacterium]